MKSQRLMHTLTPSSPVFVRQLEDTVPADFSGFNMQRKHIEMCL